MKFSKVSEPCVLETMSDARRSLTIVERFMRVGMPTTGATESRLGGYRGNSTQPQRGAHP
jgi:hypothetical protein